MTTPDSTPDTDPEVQELTDENLEEVSGGKESGRYGLQGSGTAPDDFVDAFTLTHGSSRGGVGPIGGTGGLD
jgi:hypothetical protein